MFTESEMGKITTEQEQEKPTLACVCTLTVVHIPCHGGLGSHGIDKALTENRWRLVHGEHVRTLPWLLFPE